METVILIIVVVAMFLNMALSTFLVVMVTNHIKDVFAMNREDNIERHALNLKLMEAMNNLAEVFKHGQSN